MEIVAAGTGHRPHKEPGGSNTMLFMNQVGIICNWIKANKPSRILSGMALGFDQALALSAIFCEVKFSAIIPFDGYEQLWDESSQAFFNNLLNAADQVLILSDGCYSKEKMYYRNRYLVDKSTHILTWYNNLPGGTRYTINYAKSLNREIIHLYRKFDRYDRA